MHYASMAVDQERAKRLVRARLHAGYKTAQDAVDAMDDIAYPTYKSHEGGSRGFLEHARRYARLFKVNYMWLAHNTGPMTTAEKAATVSDEVFELFSDLDPDAQSEVLDFMRFKRRR